MNFEMTGTQVRQHMSEISHQVARCRGRAPARPAVVPAARRPSRRAPGRPAGTTRPGRTGLRERLGVTLIEAGLHLLAADGPQAGG
jgi:hypothetical protein